MDIQWPLVLFSLCAGTGGSLFAFVGLSELLGGSSKARDAGSVCAIALMVVGGCLSVLHLASPLHAISAVTNLLSFSGISIELMLLAVSVVVIAAYLIASKRGASATALKVLAVFGIVFGLMIGFFCGHGYVIEAQPTWNTETLPFAYLGSSLACGAFLYAVMNAVKGSAEELGGKLGLAVLVAVVVSIVAMGSYAIFLGGDAASAQPVVFWACLVVVGMVGALAAAVVNFRGVGGVSPLAACTAGLVCAVVGGLAVRMLMWLCATGFIDLFSHTVPSVMLNL